MLKLLTHRHRLVADKTVLRVTQHTYVQTGAQPDLIQDKKFIVHVAEHRRRIRLVRIHPVLFHDLRKFPQGITECFHQLVSDAALGVRIRPQLDSAAHIVDIAYFFLGRQFKYLEAHFIRTDINCRKRMDCHKSALLFIVFQADN